jgi:DnaJ-class molecular chaperone
VKKLLQRRSKSPLTPTKKALDELVKGCKLAIYNTNLLARENCDLCSAIKNNRQKKSCSKCQITPIEGLSCQEARDLILLRNKEIKAR